MEQKLVVGNTIVEIKNGKVVITNKDMDIVLNNEIIYSVYPYDLNEELKKFIGENGTEFTNSFSDFSGDDYVYAKGSFKDVNFKFILPKSATELIQLQIGSAVNPVRFAESFDLSSYFDDRMSELDKYEEKVAALWKTVDDVCAKNEFQYDFKFRSESKGAKSDYCMYEVFLFFSGSKRANFSTSALEEILTAFVTYQKETQSIINEIEEKIKTAS